MRGERGGEGRGEVVCVEAGEGVCGGMVVVGEARRGVCVNGCGVVGTKQHFFGHAIIAI